MLIKTIFSGQTIKCDVRDRDCAHKYCLKPHNFRGGLSLGRGYTKPFTEDYRCGTRERYGCPRYITVYRT